MLQSKLHYEGPEVLKANQLFTARLRVVLGEAVRAGGRVVIATRHVSDFGDPQMTDPSAENFIAVSASRPDVAWELMPANDWQRHPWNRGIDLKLASGELGPGDTVDIVLAGPETGCPGYRGQSFAETTFRFRLGIDPAGDGDWRVAPTEECPGPRVVGNSIARARAFVTDVSGDRDVATVYVKPEDAYGNVAGDGARDVTLLLDDSEPVGQVDLCSAGPAMVDVHRPGDGGWHVLTAVSDDGVLFRRSNPFGPCPVEGHHLYWGEIHCQSGLCDGTNSPAELYEYARGAAGLDFASVTSHDFELTARDWKEIEQATRLANRPGEFVTFLGYEWSGSPGQGGDNNVYFLDDEGPLLYCAARKCPPAWDPAEGEIDKERSLADVVRELRGRRFMIVPHCGGRRCNLDFYDQTCMPLFEIHSCHRNYEHVAHEAIERGLRFGFIGGSDDHRGAVGDSYPAARERFFSAYNGLVAVYAKELTRESLWEAFFARRVYATNGCRLALDVRLNGVVMGGEVTAAPDTPLELTVWTRLDRLLDRVEVLRGTELAATFVGDGNQVEEFECTFSDVARPGATAYYVRVRQTDGGTAWSSPIWVDCDAGSDSGVT